MHTILWDWNGTLLDDVALCAQLLNTLLTRHGYPPCGGLAEYHRVFCFPIRQYYQNAGFDFSRHSFEALSEVYMSMYEPQSAACPLHAHAEEVLQDFSRQGLRQVVLSASPLYILQPQVAARGIAGYFDEILGLGDIYAKSKVALGTQFMQRTGIDPQGAVMLGDTAHDCEVARAMGTHCILFSGGHQPREALVATGAPVLDSLDALPAALAALDRR